MAFKNSRSTEMIAPLTGSPVPILGEWISVHCLNLSSGNFVSCLPPSLHPSSPSFNQLDLPPYETYDKLKQMLLLAVRECPEGFGFA